MKPTDAPDTAVRAVMVAKAMVDQAVVDELPTIREMMRDARDLIHENPATYWQQQPNYPSRYTSAVTPNAYRLTSGEFELWSTFTEGYTKAEVTASTLEAFKVLVVKRRMAGDITAEYAQRAVRRATVMLGEAQRAKLTALMDQRRKDIEKRVFAARDWWK